MNGCSAKMFMLVQFEEGGFFICQKNKVTVVQGLHCIVKYRNGGRYGAKIIAENVNKSILENIKTKKEDLESRKENQNDCEIDDLQHGNQKTISSSCKDTLSVREQRDATYTCLEESHLSSSIENNSALMGLIDELIPTYLPETTSSFGGNDSTARSTSDSCQATERQVPNVSFSQEDFNEAMEAPFIFSTPNNEKPHDPDVSTVICEFSMPIDEGDLNRHASYENLTDIPATISVPENDISKSGENQNNATRVISTVIGSEITHEYDQQNETIESQLWSTEITEDHVDDTGNSEYEPPSNNSVSDSQSDEPADDEELMQNQNLSSKTTADSSSEDSLNVNIPGRSTRDDAEMFVGTATNKKASDRKSWCMYCSTFQCKLVRHMEKKHKDIDEVKKFTDLPKNNAERLKIIETIRRKCMFVYNTDNAVNDGELLVCRRPSAHAPKPASHYQVCQKCKGFFSKKNLRHHAKKCFSHDGTKNRTLSVLGRKVLGRIHEEASEILRKDIFPILREDPIVRLIRYDRIIILYGNKLATKYGGLQHQHDFIRAQLRLLGRFLQAIKSINKEVSDFASIFQPKIYDDTITAIHQIAGYDQKTKNYATPSTAYAIGALLKKTANLVIFDCIKREDTNQKTRTEDFLKLLNEDIATSVNKPVIDSMTLQKRRKKVELPSTGDIQKLHTYLKKMRQSAVETLNKHFTLAAFMSLAESTLIAVQLFNRRRAGEIERVSIEDFKNHEGVNDNELKKMSKASQQIAKNYVRFTIRGKLNRTVPVLLSADLFQCVQKILECREKAGVLPSNPFVFGIPTRDKMRVKHLRACALMRKFAHDSNVSFPHKLTGTILRKHVATTCINLNLSENEVADVAQFMGHAEKIHRQHYRQSIVSREILKMSKVLELAQIGSDDDSNGSDIETLNDLESDDEGNSHEQPNKPGNAAEHSTGKKTEHSNEFRKKQKKRTFNDNDCESSERSFDSPTKRKKKRSTSPYGPVGRKPRWSTEETNIASDLFQKYIDKGTYPSLKEIQKKCARYPALKSRNPCVIKAWISNKIKKQKLCTK